MENNQSKMNLKEGLALFEEIVELCYETNNPRIIEVVESIYNEAKNAKDLSALIISCEELQVAINEEDILPEEEDNLQEVQEKIELMSE